MEILFTDGHFVAINKPHGLAVHRSQYIGEADTYVLQILRDMLNQYVYPCHRLDRKTSGVLLFALNKDANSKMQQLFASGEVVKKYVTIVRGYTDDSGIINYPLTTDKGKIQEAITEYKTLARSEIEMVNGKFNTARYSLVEVMPQTGRMHQIRKHFAHIFHPIIGDRPHGCNKQNRLFKDNFDMITMMLHASEISFIHPITGVNIMIKANMHPEFKRVLQILQLNTIL